MLTHALSACNFTLGLPALILRELNCQWGMGEKTDMNIYEAISFFSLKDKSILCNNLIQPLLKCVPFINNSRCFQLKKAKAKSFLFALTSTGLCALSVVNLSSTSQKLDTTSTLTVLSEYSFTG